MKALKIGELTARIPVIQGGMGVGISLSGLAGSVARTLPVAAAGSPMATRMQRRSTLTS